MRAATTKRNQQCIPLVARMSSTQLNADQCRRVLEEIAGRVYLARELLLHAGDDETRSDAAIVLLTSVGAMADEATEIPYHGGSDIWNFGPGFAVVGAAS